MSTLFLRLLFLAISVFKGPHSQPKKSSYWRAKATRHRHYECY